MSEKLNESQIETISLYKTIEYAEQKSKDESCSCRQGYAQLAKWLKELALRRSVSIHNQFMDNNPVSYLMFGDFSGGSDNIKNYCGCHISSGCVNAIQK